MFLPTTQTHRLWLRLLCMAICLSPASAWAAKSESKTGDKASKHRSAHGPQVDKHASAKHSDKSGDRSSKRGDSEKSPKQKGKSVKQDKATAALRKSCASAKNRSSKACKALVQADRKAARNEDSDAKHSKDKDNHAKKGADATDAKDTAKSGSAAKSGAGTKDKDGAKDSGDGHDSAKPLSAKEKKRLDALGKLCADKKQKKSAKCQAYRSEMQQRTAAAERVKLKKLCAPKANRGSKQCKDFVIAEKKRQQVISICGRKYGVAKKNEKIAAFAKRMRVSEARIRDLNELAKLKVLKGGKRYLVYKSPHDGVTLQGGELLEAESGIYTLQRPERGWGKPLLVAAIAQAAKQVQAQSPDLPWLVVGDLSKERGGCLPPHKSHRGGVDADIGFYYRGAHQRRWLGGATPETLDADRTWQLIKTLQATGKLEFVFMDHSLHEVLYQAALRAGETPQTLQSMIQWPRPIERAHETVVRHLDGHDNHMHVRLRCPEKEECNLTEDMRNALAQVRQDRMGGPVAESPPQRWVGRPQRALPGLP